MLAATFSGWIEAFPARTETAAEVPKALLKEIIPRFGLPGSLERENGPSFVSQVTKWLTSALGIKWTLHSAWRPQSSGKVERSSQTMKQALPKLCQETQENPIVSIALLPMWLAPKDKLKLSTFELRCGRSIPQAREKGYLNSLEMEQLSMPFR